MLKPEMIEKLNEQMNLELYSSLLYQQMSAWCSYHTFEGAAAFLRRHAQEEMTHMPVSYTHLNMPFINSLRPAPTRPNRPTISPLRTARLIGVRTPGAFTASRRSRSSP